MLILFEKVHIKTYIDEDDIRFIRELGILVDILDRNTLRDNVSIFNLSQLHICPTITINLDSPS